MSVKLEKVLPPRDRGIPIAVLANKDSDEVYTDNRKRFVVLHDTVGSIGEDHKTEVNVKNCCHLRQFPNPYARECLTVVGPSGVGKSTYVANYLKLVNEVSPKMPIYIVSKVKEDPAFSEVQNIHFIDGDALLALGDGEHSDDEEEENDPRETASEAADKFKNCVVVFDDIDQFDKRVLKRALAIRDAILEVGRHNNVYIINTAHILRNYQKSRILINESTWVVFFPSASWFQIEAYLKGYLGFSKQLIAKIKGLQPHSFHYP